MTKIELPEALEQLLRGSEYEAGVLSLVDAVGQILQDNKLPFFPDYTDHGTQHINDVLRTEVELVPEGIWAESLSPKRSGPLSDVDAALIVGGTLLHDIAMHLRSDGFLELIRPDSGYSTIPWFNEDREGHVADRPWVELWNEFDREARRFSRAKLGSIVGRESAREWTFEGLHHDTGAWTLNDHLVIGEFIRRHHARIGHEIALFGFPGARNHSALRLDRAEGPLKRVADLIGLVARSHGISLRTCRQYLSEAAPYMGTPTPLGSAVLFPMALLRVADYFQIQAARAPAILLRLRNPASPVSLQEWRKHGAILSISSANDPWGKMITVRQGLGIEVLLQVRSLIDGLQSELDHSTAVLDEAYGRYPGLNKLGLATRRVHSNVRDPKFVAALPYVPKDTGYTVDANLMGLLVEPLYGRSPGVGVRELLQNAVDAVVERHAIGGDKGGVDTEEGSSTPDVSVDFLHSHGNWTLRVEDRGVGMSGRTIEKYFLRAGATFRGSSDWDREFRDDEGRVRVVRSGRFGVGVFALFLLGSSFRMYTRHAHSPETGGFRVEGSIDCQRITIYKHSLSRVGTRIEVDLDSGAVRRLGIELVGGRFDRGNLFPLYKSALHWYSWAWPRVVIRVDGTEIDDKEKTPGPRSDPDPQWSAIHPEGFDAVHWSCNPTNEPPVICNGIEIRAQDGNGPRWLWRYENRGLRRPALAVTDSDAKLPVDMRRYSLTRSDLPFASDVAVDVTLSFIAHALICGPRSTTEAYDSDRYFPLCERDEVQGVRLSQAFPLHWCVTDDGFLPADRALLDRVDVEGHVVFGVIGAHEDDNCVDVVGLPKTFDENLIPKGVVSSCRIGNIGRSKGLSSWIKNLHVFCFDRPERHASGRVLVAVSPELRSDLRSLGKSFKVTDGIVDQHRVDTCTEVELAWGEQYLGNELDRILTGLVSSARVAGFAAVFAATGRRGQSFAFAENSLMSSLWQERLGRTTIPFGDQERRRLIKHAMTRGDLARHIEAWERKKSTVP